MSEKKFHVTIANGRGRCQECKEPIPKGERQLTFSHGSGQWGTTGNLCKRCNGNFYVEIEFGAL